MTADKKTILFTIELKHRELVPKCLLALQCARLGFRAYLGTFAGIRSLKGRVTASIFFHKSTMTKWIADNRQNYGAVSVFLDEEAGIGIPRSGVDEFCRSRYRQAQPGQYAHVFVLNDRYARAMAALPELAGTQTHVTGWPRIDLWRPEFRPLFQAEVERLKARYGAFYLYVSSFGASSLATFEDRIRIHEARHYQLGIELTKERRQAFTEQVAMLKRLAAALPADQTIVFRPHTSEKIADWEREFAADPKIKVIQEGDVTPWVLAAQAILNFNSTVGVQAALNGIPSVIYRAPSANRLADTPIYDLAHHAAEVEDVVAYLRDVQSRSPAQIAAAAIARLGGDLAAADGRLASAKIAEILGQIAVRPIAPIRVSPGQRLRARWQYVRDYGVLKLVAARDWLVARRRGGRPGTAGRGDPAKILRNTYEKVPGGLPEGELRQTLASLGPRLGIAPAAIVCREISKNVVEVELDA